MQFGISEALEFWGKYRPENIAVYYNNISLNYKALNFKVDQFANYLLKMEIEDERIGIALSTKINFLICLLAILKLGKSVVTFNVGLPPEAVLLNLEDTRVNFVIIEVGTKNKFTSRKLKLIEFGLANWNNSAHSLKTSLRHPTDEWGVLFSSGTTGVPKGIERDHNSIITELVGWCLELGLNRSSSFYIGRPIFYTGGLVLSLSTLLVSGSVIINDYYDYNDPLMVWNDYQSYLKKYKVTWAFFIPDQLRIFTKIVKESKQSPLSAENILVMGAPISGEEKKHVVKYLGSNIIESWGNSESLGTITDPEDVHLRPNSIGRPFLTDEMFIVDDDGTALPAKELGRIAGGEEAGFIKYSNRPNETTRVKKQELIISDDIGYVDDDGYFYVCGRRQELITTQESTIFLPDLEQKIRKVDGILESCIVSQTQNDGSFCLFAFIVILDDRNADKEFFKQKINNLMNDNEKITDVIFLSKLPRVPSGKVDKLQLEKMIENSK